MGRNRFSSSKFGRIIEFLKSKIKNEKLDIGYIKNTDHGYTDKEEQLGEEIVKFLIDIYK